MFAYSFISVYSSPFHWAFNFCSSFNLLYRNTFWKVPELIRNPTNKKAVRVASMTLLILHETEKHHVSQMEKYSPCSIAFTRLFVILMASSKVTKEV